MKTTELIDSINIAKSLKEDKLKKIAQEVSEGFESDLKSREAFEHLLEHWTKIALQVVERKTFPWNNASNVKYPLLATASMQFAARAYPSLVPASGDVVKCKIVGFDPDGSKTDKATRIGKFMSYQLLDEMEEWEEDFDRLLITLPIVGTVFKKTYWDSQKERNVSRVVMPKALVVNYWTKSLEDSERITEIIPMSKRKVREKVLSGLYLDLKLGEPIQSGIDNVKVYGQTEPDVDETTPYTILEQHCFLDLDEDGYAEPYIVTFEKESKQILRITARYSEEDVSFSEDGKKVVRIEPQQYYTKFGFVPNPDGGFYDIGFGRLLGPLNDSADTIINQLIDGGTISNLQAGFIGKGLRMKMGEGRFTPGEWKVVNATGDDIKKQIFPLPVRDPSPVLLELLKFLITAGKELASVAEIFVGKMPGQNTPATTTMASIDQGMKVFTAVYKRIYRSLTKEFRKLYKLNRIYLNAETEVDILGTPIPQSDFAGSDHTIVPGADPAAVSAQEKQAKVQALLQILQLGTIDPMFVTKMYLDAYEIPNAEQAMKQPAPPQPSPEQQKAQAQIQLIQEQGQLKQQDAILKSRLKMAEGQQKMDLLNQKAQDEATAASIEARLQQEAIVGHSNVEQATQVQQHALDMQHAEETHQQKMHQQQEVHKQQLKQPKGPRPK